MLTGLDDEVDDDNRQIIEWIGEQMKQSPDRVLPGIAMFSAIRHLERIAEEVIHAAASEGRREPPRSGGASAQRGGERKRGPTDSQ